MSGSSNGKMYVDYNTLGYDTVTPEKSLYHNLPFRVTIILDEESYSRSLLLNFMDKWSTFIHGMRLIDNHKHLLVDYLFHSKQDAILCKLTLTSKHQYEKLFPSF